MRGEIDYSSVPGRGSTFWFTARFGIATGPAAAAGADSGSLQPAGEQLAGGSFTGYRVLVADDMEVNRILCREMLELLGAEAAVVNDGQQAAEAVANGSYDLLIMDCRMPVLDGFSATRRIRAWEMENHAKRIPIIALTAHAVEDARTACLEAGMDDHLPKPFRFEQLRAILEQWLRAPSVA
jgi:CheY-like chemotaxis protein